MKNKNYFVKVCKSSKIMSHPGHLQAPRPNFEYCCWWLATRDAKAGFICSPPKFPAKKFRFKSFRSKLAATGGCKLETDDWLAPVKRLLRFSVISSRRKLIKLLRNWLIGVGLSHGFTSFTFTFGLSRLPFTWFSRTFGDSSRGKGISSFSLKFSGATSLVWLLLLLLSFLKFTFSLPLSNRCPLESDEWILWLLSSPQYSLQCERSGEEKKKIRFRREWKFLIMKRRVKSRDRNSQLLIKKRKRGTRENLLSFLITFQRESH